MKDLWEIFKLGLLITMIVTIVVVPWVLSNAWELDRQCNNLSTLAAQGNQIAQVEFAKRCP